MSNDLSVVGQGVVCFKKCVWFLTLTLPLAFDVCLHKVSDSVFHIHSLCISFCMSLSLRLFEMCSYVKLNFSF